MKVKKLENVQNKMGLKGCHWSSLSAPGTETPSTSPWVGLMVGGDVILHSRARRIEREGDKNPKSLLYKMLRYVDSGLNFTVSLLNKDNYVGMSH